MGLLDGGHLGCIIGPLRNRLPLTAILGHSTGEDFRGHDDAPSDHAGLNNLFGNHVGKSVGGVG